MEEFICAYCAIAYWKRLQKRETQFTRLFAAIFWILDEMDNNPFAADTANDTEKRIEIIK